jgi:hypothetical protein
VQGNFNFYNVFKNSTKSLLLYGPIYATISVYWLYTPKEKYWITLEKKKKNYSSIQELTELPAKPRNKINFNRNKENIK